MIYHDAYETAIKFSILFIIKLWYEWSKSRTQILSRIKLRQKFFEESNLALYLMILGCLLSWNEYRENILLFQM